MSLDHIRDMRIARKKPSGIVTVVIGSLPKKFRTDPLMVEIKAGVNPSLLDLRPLVGVWVAAILIEGQQAALDQAIEALAKAGAKLFGFACEGKAETLCSFDDSYDQQKAKSVLYREWGALCS
jgi:hypothetical protein